MYVVYALKFIDNEIYVGMTDGLEERISEHKKGRVKSTKNKGRFKIIYVEKCLDRSSARAREKYWKSGYGKAILKNIQIFL